jgi:hypothetical protein
VDGVTAIQFAIFPDWAGYTCTGTGSEAQIDAAIDSDEGAIPANWTVSATDKSDTLETKTPPWQPCSSASLALPPLSAPVVRPPKAGPVPQHPGQDVQLIPPKPATGSQYWVYNLTGHLVSTLSFGPENGVWHTTSIAPGIYRVKAKVDYEDGTTFVGWLNVAIVP